MYCLIILVILLIMSFPHWGEHFTRPLNANVYFPLMLSMCVPAMGKTHTEHYNPVSNTQPNPLLDAFTAPVILGGGGLRSS